jgi:hypothetical protein
MTFRTGPTPEPIAPVRSLTVEGPQRPGEGVVERGAVRAYPA